MNNFPNLSFILVFLISTKIITEEEADNLTKELSDKKVPTGWRNIKQEIEEIIKRKI